MLGLDLRAFSAADACFLGGGGALRVLLDSVRLFARVDGGRGVQGVVWSGRWVRRDGPS